MLEFFIGLIVGMVVYIGSNIIEHTYFDTYILYNQLKGRIVYMFEFHAPFYDNPYDPMATGEIKISPYHEKASNDTRALACQLYEIASLRHKYHPGIPRPDVLKQAAKSLFFISNSLTLAAGSSNNRAMDKYRDRQIEEIEKNEQMVIKLLKIPQQHMN